MPGGGYYSGDHHPPNYSSNSGASDMMGLAQGMSDLRQDVNTIIGYNKRGDIIRKGQRYDRRQEQKFYDKAIARGLTPWEYYGTPAAGSATGSQATQQIGNMANTQIAAMQDQAQAGMAASAQIQTAKIQAGAAKEVAKINTGQQERELQQRIKEYNTISLPTLSKDLKIKENQLKLQLNEIANTDHKWIRRKVILQMGPDNMITGSIADKYGVDFSDPASIDSMSPEMYEAMLAEVAIQASRIRREVLGVANEVRKVILAAAEESKKARESRMHKRTEDSNRRTLQKAHEKKQAEAEFKYQQSTRLYAHKDARRTNPYR